MVAFAVQTQSIQALKLSFHLNTQRKEPNRKWLISSFPCPFFNQYGFFPIFKRAMVNGQQRPFSVLMVSLKNWGKKEMYILCLPTYIPTFTVNVYYIQLDKWFSEVAVWFIFFKTLISRDLSLMFLLSWAFVWNFVQGFLKVLFHNTVSSKQNTWEVSYEALYQVLFNWVEK